MHLAVCAICKNEAPYLAEWIAWQKAIGFDRVIIYDNVSDDGTSELLVALHEAGEITRIHWPREPDVAPQRAAYAHFLQTDALDYDWALICDLDEFLVLRDFDLRGFIAAAEAANTATSAIAIPWLVFGSGGAETQMPGLVIERFTRCDATPGPHVKTLFRPAHAYAFRTHICDLMLGEYVDNTFKRPAWSNDMPIDLQTCAPGHALIHHYFTKSREEWVRRRAMGKADRAAEETRRLSLFNAYHDQPAECHDALAMLPSVRDGIARLQDGIAAQAAVLEGFGVELLALNASCLICRTEALPPGSRLRVVLNDRHEIITRNLKILADGGCGFVVNVRWLGEAVDSIRIAPVGALRAVTIGRDAFLPRWRTLRNLRRHLPQAEQLLFDYFVKLADTKQGIATVRAQNLPAFTKFMEYGDLIVGILAHEDSPADLGRFLQQYDIRHGKAGQQALSRFQDNGHYLSDLIRTARACIAGR